VLTCWSVLIGARYRDILVVITVVTSPAIMTALHEVRFVTEALNITQPDLSLANPIKVTVVLTLVSNRTNYSVINFIHVMANGLYTH